MKKPIPVSPHAQALIFDLDGTLADTMPLHFKAWQELSTKYAFQFSEPLFYSLGGVPTRSIFAMINEQQGLTLNIDKLLTEKEDIFLKRVHEVLPIEPVLQVVKKHLGLLSMAIATGGYRRVMQKILPILTLLESDFGAIVTADDVTKHKPDPETFLLAAQKLGVPPHLCQVFEDADPGLDAARAAGMLVTDVREFL